MLDGGLATTLEDAGHDLNDPLWSAKVLIETPEAFGIAHRAFLEAGADCIATGTYQATAEGFARRGLTADQTRKLLRQAVGLATEARDAFWDNGRAEPGGERVRPLVAASVGPYGAFLADGSEYRGDYGMTVSDLVAFHEPRWVTTPAPPRPGTNGNQHLGRQA